MIACVIILYCAMQKLLLTILAAFAVSVSSRAQYDVSFSHYFDMQPSYNPAAVGIDTKMNISGAYAMSFVGFRHSPKTMYVSADMPLYAMKMYHGVGVQLLNDQIGLFTHQRISAQYAAKTKLAGGQLSLGAQVGLLTEKFDGSKLDLEDASDPAFSSSQVDGNSVDFAAGVHYKHGDWYVGAAMQHVTAPTVELGETNEINVSSSYYLHGGYNIKLRNPFITIHPSFIVRTDGVDHREDVTCRVAYTNDQKKYYAGLGYAWDKSATVYLGALVKGFNVGYSYEIYTSQIKIGNGSHELYVGYQMDIDFHKKGRNLHKSVRFL